MLNDRYFRDFRQLSFDGIEFFCLSQTQGNNFLLRFKVFQGRIYHI